MQKLFSRFAASRAERHVLLAAFTFGPRRQYHAMRAQWWRQFTKSQLRYGQPMWAVRTALSGTRAKKAGHPFTPTATDASQGRGTPRPGGFVAPVVGPDSIRRRPF